ncbi:MAG: hypothetical protein ACREMY_02455, partial [bacterium]
GNTIDVADIGARRISKWKQPWSPEAITQAATNISSTEATLNGTVNASGASTTYYFEYGTTTAYGAKAPVIGGSAGSESDRLAVSQAVSGLKGTTTYHFRLVASNNEGVTYGNDLLLKTGPSTASKLAEMSVTEVFDGSSASLARFSTEWSTLGWAGGAHPKGGDSTTGWRPIDTYSTVNGAFFKATITDTGPGTATVVTMTVNPSNPSRYFSLWLDASGSAATRTGYELRFTYVTTNTYDVALSRWQSGAQAILASKSSYSFVNGNSFAVTDEDGTVSAWTDIGSGFSQLLSASDSSFSAGNAGVEGSGNIMRLTKFKAGSL